MADSIPYLSSPASDSPSSVALGANTARSLYPGADKGTQDPPVSQHRSAKWWPSGVETKRPAHPLCAASRRFGNRGHDCLGPHDFRSAVTAHGELRSVMVPPGAPSVIASQHDQLITVKARGGEKQMVLDKAGITLWNILLLTNGFLLVHLVLPNTRFIKLHGYDI
jgi:hypothetical protein